MNLTHTRAHPPVPPVCDNSHHGAGYGARVKLTRLADVKQSRPATRLYKRTREVGLLHRGRPDYRVDLDRVPDAAALLGWIEHLAGKTWVTPRHIRELIEHAERENGIKIGRNA